MYLEISVAFQRILIDFAGLGKFQESSKGFLERSRTHWCKGSRNLKNAFLEDVIFLPAP